MLMRRGLLPEKLAEVKRICEELSRVAVSTPLSSGKEEVRRANQAQLAALADLRLWYTDWATTLRTVFGTRDQLRLGLTRVKRNGDDDEDVLEPEPAPIAGAAV